MKSIILNLAASIKNLARRIQEEEEREEMSNDTQKIFSGEGAGRHIEYLAQQDGIDALTGLTGLKVFRHELEHALACLKGEQEGQIAGKEPLKEIALIALNVDHLEKVNTTYGHAAGDEVLRQVASLLMMSIPETDTIARINGRELMILMKGVDAHTAALHAEEIRRKISQLTLSGYPGLALTASFGVVSSKESTNPRILQEYADEALYGAKRDGRNQVKTHSPGEEATHTL